MILVPNKFGAPKTLNDPGVKPPAVTPSFFSYGLNILELDQTFFDLRSGLICGLVHYGSWKLQRTVTARTSLEVRRSLCFQG